MNNMSQFHNTTTTNNISPNFTRKQMQNVNINNNSNTIQRNLTNNFNPNINNGNQYNQRFNNPQNQQKPINSYGN